MDWPTLLGLVGVPLSLGLTMAATTPGEFRFIRICLWASALALALNYGYRLWDSEEPIGVKGIAIAAALGAILAGMLAYTLDWVKTREAGTLSKALPSSDTENKRNDTVANGPTIVVEANFQERPTKFPLTGIVHGFGFGPQGYVIDKKDGDPGSATGWARTKPDEPDWALRLRFSVATEKPLYGLQVKLHAAIYDAIIGDQPDSSSAGRMLDKVTYDYYIGSLKPGDTYVLWVRNGIFNYVELLDIVEARYKDVGDLQTKPVKIVFEKPTPLILFPINYNGITWDWSVKTPVMDRKD